MEAGLVVDTLLRGLAMGGFAATLLVMLTGRHPSRVMLLGAVTYLCILAHIADGLLVWQGTDGTGYDLVWIASNIAPGFLWAFLLAVFDDGPDLFWPRLMPAALLTASLTGALLILPDMSVYWWVYYAVTLGLMLHVVWVMARGLGTDLIEARRRLRAPVILLATVYIALNAVANIVPGPFHASGLHWHLVQAGFLVVLGFGSAVGFLEAGPIVWAAAPAMPEVSDAPDKPPAPEPDGVSRALLARLQHAMTVEEAWREEGLTIGALAGRLAIPEYRLRRLINEQLGHRNFADYINSHRIAAARTILADPAHATTQVSQLAFELGFGSLGPFNRAFKLATGKSPSQWRDEALAESRKEQPNS